MPKVRKHHVFDLETMDWYCTISNPRDQNQTLELDPQCQLEHRMIKIRFNALQGSIFSQLLTNKLQHSAEPTCQWHCEHTSCCVPASEMSVMTMSMSRGGCQPWYTVPCIALYQNYNVYTFNAYRQKTHLFLIFNPATWLLLNKQASFPSFDMEINKLFDITDTITSLQSTYFKTKFSSLARSANHWNLPSSNKKLSKIYLFRYSKTNLYSAWVFQMNSIVLARAVMRQHSLIIHHSCPILIHNRSLSSQIYGSLWGGCVRGGECHQRTRVSSG